MKRIAAVLALAVALGASGCGPSADNRVPASSSPWAACPKGDAGRVKDSALLPPHQWVCVR